MKRVAAYGCGGGDKHLSTCDDIQRKTNSNNFHDELMKCIKHHKEIIA